MIPLYIIRITNYEKGVDEIIITNLQDKVDEIRAETIKQWPQVTIQIETKDIEKPFVIRQEY